MTHLLKLVDKMCINEMDLTWFHSQMDKWMDRQGEISIPPFNFVEGGYDKKIWDEYMIVGSQI